MTLHIFVRRNNAWIIALPTDSARKDNVCAALDMLNRTVLNFVDPINMLKNQINLKESLNIDVWRGAQRRNTSIQIM